MKKIELDGASLRLVDLLPILRGEEVVLSMDDDAVRRLRAARQLVDRHIDAGDVVYGLTTGFGKLKNVAIAAGDLAQLQRNLVLSHCVGVGPPMPPEEARVAQVLRINGLLRGHSGVRVATVEAMLRGFAAGFVPVIPQQGSVGASGDLAPLAHMAAAYMGVGEAWVRGRRMDAGKALAEIGEEPLVLGAKEGLALINGTEIMKATGSLTLLRAMNLSKVADIAAAMTLEGLFGSIKPFDDRLAQLKGHAGHRRTSKNVRTLLEGSEVLESHIGCDRVQDPYSLRCVPQVHGAVKGAIEHVDGIFSGELNSVTDNPILFPDTDEVISAGQFHGQPVSMVLDYLGISICTLANISERRVEQLVNPDLSSLPAFLTPRPGLNSGFMIAQVAAAALASENKSFAHPASVDTVPTSANQEDHVSMGVTAARKAREIVTNTERVLGIELCCAAQARDFHPEFKAGKGVEAAHAAVREVVETLGDDRYLHPDLNAATELLKSGALVERVESAVGPLDS